MQAKKLPTLLEGKAIWLEMTEAEKVEEAETESKEKLIVRMAPDHADGPSEVRFSGRFPRLTVTARGVALGVPPRLEAAAGSGHARGRGQHQDTVGPTPVHHRSTRPH